MRTLSIYCLSIVIALSVAWLAMIPEQVDAAGLVVTGGACCDDHITGGTCDTVAGSPTSCTDGWKKCVDPSGSGTEWDFTCCVSWPSECVSHSCCNCI
jgi:hypothetical protein